MLLGLLLENYSEEDTRFVLLEIYKGREGRGLEKRCFPN